MIPLGCAHSLIQEVFLSIFSGFVINLFIIGTSSGEYLMKMKQQEQEQIFNEWLGQYKGLFFKIVRAYAFNKDDQDDLFQEIILQVWRSIPSFKGASAVSTWLYRISLNTAMKWTTKQHKHKEGRQSLEPARHILTPKDQLMDERLVWLYEEIARFNELDRSLALLLLEGFSYKEMAQMIGIAESNVGVRIHRIKKQLITKSKKYDNYAV